MTISKLDFLQNVRGKPSKKNKKILTRRGPENKNVGKNRISRKAGLRMMRGLVGGERLGKDYLIRPKETQLLNKKSR